MGGLRMKAFLFPRAFINDLRRVSASVEVKQGYRGRASLISTAQSNPDLANEIGLMQRRGLPEGWDRNFPVFSSDSKGVAGRDASGKVLNVLAQNIPWLLGGSGYLGPSNRTTLTYEGAGDFQAENY